MTDICLLVEGKTFKTFDKLKNEFGLENRDMLRYFQLRDFYEKEIKGGISLEGNNVIKVFMDAYKQTPTKIVSILFSSLQNRNGCNSLLVNKMGQRTECCTVRVIAIHLHSSAHLN